MAKDVNSSEEYAIFMSHFVDRDDKFKALYLNKKEDIDNLFVERSMDYLEILTVLTRISKDEVLKYPENFIGDRYDDISHKLLTILSRKLDLNTAQMMNMFKRYAADKSKVETKSIVLPKIVELKEPQEVVEPSFDEPEIEYTPNEIETPQPEAENNPPAEPVEEVLENAEEVLEHEEAEPVDAENVEEEGVNPYPVDEYDEEGEPVFEGRGEEEEHNEYDGSDEVEANEENDEQIFADEVIENPQDEPIRVIDDKPKVYATANFRFRNENEYTKSFEKEDEYGDEIPLIDMITVERSLLSREELPVRVIMSFMLEQAKKTQMLEKRIALAEAKLPQTGSLDIGRMYKVYDDRIELYKNNRHFKTIPNRFANFGANTQTSSYQGCVQYEGDFWVVGLSNSITVSDDIEVSSFGVNPHKFEEILKKYLTGL